MAFFLLGLSIFVFFLYLPATALARHPRSWLYAFNVLIATISIATASVLLFTGR